MTQASQRIEVSVGLETIFFAMQVGIFLSAQWVKILKKS